MKKYKCSKCGKLHDSETEVKFCADCGAECKAVDEKAENKDTNAVDVKGILGQVKEAVTEAVKGVKDAVDGVTDKVDGIEGRLKSIEDMPAPNKAFAGISMGAGGDYKGYNMNVQGAKFRARFSKSPEDFPTLSNGSKMDDLCKFMIDFSKASRGDVAMQKELQAKTAMTGATDSLGGYNIPDEFNADIVRLIEDISFGLQECTTMPMKHRQMDIPTELTRVGTAYWVAENGGGTASNPTFGNAQLNAKKLFGLTDYISQELLDDSAVDIAGLLLQQFSYGQAQEIDNQLLNGTGTPFSGVLTASAGNSIVLSSDAFSSIVESDLSLAMAQLKVQDLNQAKWVYNKLVQHYMRGLSDDQGRPIFQFPSMKAPGTIYEVPYIQSENAPSTTGASTAFMALANWKAIIIGIRKKAMALDIDPFTGFSADKVRFRMIQRYAFAYGRADAVVRVVTGA